MEAQDRSPKGYEALPPDSHAPVPDGGRNGNNHRNGRSARKPIVIKLSEIKAKPPEFPRVVKRNHQLFLEVQGGMEYQIPKGPIKTMGLLHHLAGKIWAEREFLFYAIARIAQARGWQIHPF